MEPEAAVAAIRVDAAVLQGIELNPEISFGKPTRRGTRKTLAEVPVAHLADFMITRLLQLQQFLGG